MALEVAGAVAITCAVNPTIAEVGLAASHAIFVDGTKSPILSDLDDPADRMRDSFAGRYDFPGDDPEFVRYPGTVGLASVLTDGFGAPTFDASEQVAVDDLVQRVKANQTGGDRTATTYLVGYSQGAGAVVRAVADLENAEDSNYDAAHVVVVLAANPRRNDGGVLTRFPAFTLPLIGATFGVGTDPSQTRIIQVTKQYDGVADAPLYVLNVVADLNAVLGFVYLHGGYYRDVDIDPENPPADALVTTHSDGRVTDILLRNKPGDLPLTRPLLDLGVPRDVVLAMDPALRAIIESGYDRPANGSVTSDRPVPFKLLPSAGDVARNTRSVAEGDEPASPAPTAPQSSPVAEPTPATADASGRAAKAPTTTVADGEHGAVAGSNPRKFTPPRSAPGGWKPGMLLRGVRDAVTTAFTPRSTTADSPSPSAPADPVAPSATVGSSPEKDSATTAAAS
ncbi:PE-PPE domain-containing protein [Mycolicibacterium sediminis]|uniref:PE-PPE domain-containing protein n=1 Tax=Mycolicibacterium sediminis TaxID=1286180 RepID=A0A7I7QQ97_9MYCO|nr:PE-PPE domain-containing protein [Mycolicibacterium sediminis]BBY28549.1 hypothetical protein MSEDJ_26450 [Mycolicibacterium sediminis]